MAEYTVYEFLKEVIEQSDTGLDNVVLEDPQNNTSLDLKITYNYKYNEKGIQANHVVIKVDNSTLHEEIEELKANLEASDNRILDLEGEVSEKNQEIDRLEDEISALKYRLGIEL